MIDEIKKIEDRMGVLKSSEPSFIPDGAIDISRYPFASPRILWILKEPNGPGDWDLRTYFRERLFSYSKWQATAGLMIKVSHGLLHGLRDWGNWADDARALADSLRDVAVININKRGGTSRARWAPLEKAGIDFGDLIESQVKALDPQVTILANCIQFLPLQVRERLKSLENAPDNSAYVDGTVYINAYHPNQMTITHENYYGKIMASILRHDQTLVEKDN